MAESLKPETRIGVSSFIRGKPLANLYGRTEISAPVSAKSQKNFEMLSFAGEEIFAMFASPVDRVDSINFCLCRVCSDVGSGRRR